MAELKKCHFCGGEAKITCESNYGGIETISCKKCHANIRRLWCEGTALESEVDVLGTWNNRANEAEIRAKAIDEFAEKLKELFKYESAWGETQYYQRLVIDISKIDEIAEQLKGELGIAHRNNRC